MVVNNLLVNWLCLHWITCSWFATSDMRPLASATANIFTITLKIPKVNVRSSQKVLRTLKTNRRTFNFVKSSFSTLSSIFHLKLSLVLRIRLPQLLFSMFLRLVFILRSSQCSLTLHCNNQSTAFHLPNVTQIIFCNIIL